MNQAQGFIRRSLVIAMIWAAQAVLGISFATRDSSVARNSNHEDRAVASLSTVELASSAQDQEDRNPPVIEFVPPFLVLVPILGFEVGTITGLAYDLDPPYVVVLASLQASATFFCIVEDIVPFGFTFTILTPTGRVETGLGLGGIAVFRAVVPPLPSAWPCGEYSIYAVDFNGNSSFGVAPVILFSIF